MKNLSFTRGFLCVADSVAPILLDVRISLHIDHVGILSTERVLALCIWPFAVHVIASFRSTFFYLANPAVITVVRYA